LGDDDGVEGVEVLEDRGGDGDERIGARVCGVMFDPAIFG
jgi:hypothetical protein